VTYLGDDPVSASVSWSDGTLAEAAPLLLVTDRIPGGTPKHIEETTGRAIARSREQPTARATAADAEDLGITAGSPVLAGRSWWYDSAGEVIEFGEHVSGPDRWTTYDSDKAT
jgi:DNA-binding GntR family transcriptional regulator